MRGPSYFGSHRITTDTFGETFGANIQRTGEQTEAQKSVGGRAPVGFRLGQDGSVYKTDLLTKSACGTLLCKTDSQVARLGAPPGLRSGG
jgi:hypothetical protein